MKALFSAALPLVLMLACFVVPIYVLSWLRKLQRRNRRSPLTAKLLRGPGETLRHELEDVQGDFGAYLTVLWAFPVMTYAIHVSQSYFGASPETFGRWIWTGIIAAGGTVFLSWKLYRLSRLRFDLQNGLEAEIAMGQELDQLMRESAVVFHDFPAEGFNIDHVVVTRKGMYAIETKGRMKPDRGGGKKDATVQFDGKVLSFPDWRDSQTLDQARRQAKWLAKWISSAVGESIEVRPVVALPGWFVDATGRGDVTVISGREAPKWLKGWQSVPFSEDLMTRIEHQLEQHCRDIEPTLYGKQAGKVWTTGTPRALSGQCAKARRREVSSGAVRRFRSIGGGARRC